MQTVFGFVDKFNESIGIVKLATLYGVMWIIYIVLCTLFFIKIKPDNSKLICIFIAFLILSLNMVIIELLTILFGNSTYKHLYEQITSKNKNSENEPNNNQYEIESDEIQNFYYQYQICPIIHIFVAFGIKDLTASFGMHKQTSKISFLMYFYFLFRSIILQPQQSYILVASIAGIIYLIISDAQSQLNIVNQQDQSQNNIDIHSNKYRLSDMSRVVIDQSQLNILNNTKLNMSAQQRMQDDRDQNKSITQQQCSEQKSQSYQKEMCTESIKQNILKIIPQGLGLITNDYDLIYSNETIQNLFDAGNSELIDIIQKISVFQTGTTQEYQQKVRYEVSQQRSLGQIEGKKMDILDPQNVFFQEKRNSVDSISSVYYDKIQNIQIQVQNISKNLRSNGNLESSIKISSSKEQKQIQQTADNVKDSKLKSKFYNMRNKQDNSSKTNSILTTKPLHQNYESEINSHNDIFLNMEVEKIPKQDRSKIQEAITLKEIMDYILNETTQAESSDNSKDVLKNDDSEYYEHVKNKQNKNTNQLQNSFVHQIKNISNELLNQSKRAKKDVVKQMNYQTSFDLNQNVDQLSILKSVHDNKLLSQKSCPTQNYDSSLQNQSKYYFKSENLKTTSKEVNIICHHKETQKLIELRLTKCKINLPNNSSENFDQNEFENSQISIPCILIMCEEISEKLYLTKMMRMAAYKSKMLASISHELRTPLNCSIGMLQLLLDRDDIKRDILDFVVTPALYSNKLLLNIINDILDYNQINAGDFKLNFTIFNFKKVIEDCLMLVRYSCQLKNLNLTIKCQESLDNMEINSDPQRITQILLNLIQNAIKFTEEGGQITVTLSLHDTDLIQIDVSDTGCGIPLKKLRNLFNNFGKVQRDATTERVIRDDQGFGAGLGLTISNKLAKGVGCNRAIKVATQLYKGSTFTFYVKNQTSKSFMFKKNTLKTFFSSVSDQTLYESSLHKSLYHPRSSKQEQPQITHSPKQMDEITSEKVLKSIRILDKKDFPFYHSKQIVDNKSEERTWNGSNNLNTTSAVGFKLSESLHSSVQFEKEETSKYSATHKSESFFYADLKEIQLLQQADQNFKEKILYYSRNIQCKNCSPILIVDDNEFNILTLRCLLNSYELKVDYALNGKLAFEMVQEKLKNQISITQLTEFFQSKKQGKAKSPSSLKKFENSKIKETECTCNGYKLIFMDIEMPIMNGFQSAQKIIGLFKDYFTNVKKPFISTCSAFVTEQDQQKARESGMNFFLEKPISKIKLEFLLNKVFLNNINF